MNHDARAKTAIHQDRNNMTQTSAWLRNTGVALAAALLLLAGCVDKTKNPFADDNGDGDPGRRTPRADVDAATGEGPDTMPPPDAEPDAALTDADMRDPMDDDDSGMESTDPEPTPCADDDKDGHPDATCGGDDCNDGDANIHPGMAEVCENGIDDDCDSTTTDTGDNDRDGYACAVDCDDRDPRVNPGRVEVCANDIDDDCNPSTADVFDADGDGRTCDMDCDDDDPRIGGGSTIELCANGIDDDCDPSTPDVFDSDGDKISCLLDCDDTDATLPNGSFYCGSEYSYYASFDDSDEGWVADADSSWNRGAPRNRKFQSEAGRIGWFTQGQPEEANALYQTYENSYLTSPSLDFSGLANDPVLQFDRIRSFETAGEVTLEISTDGGFIWQAVPATPLDLDFSDASDPSKAPSFYARSATPTWARARTLLVGTAGLSDVRLRFRMSSTAVRDAGIGIDNVRISSHAYDAVAKAVVVPHDGCGTNRNVASVTLTVRNNSSQPIASVPVSYQRTGGSAVTETLAGPIPVGGEAVHTFTTRVDVSAVGTHGIQAWVSIPGDQYHLNDRLLANTHTFPVLAMGDYFEDFESGGGEWFTRGKKSSWAWGTPIGDRIQGAASGTHAWATNPYGAHNPQEQSSLTSPCLDFSGTSVDPELLFAMAYDLDDVNGRASAQLSRDGGATFAVLNGDPDSINWHNDGTDQFWEDLYPYQTRRSDTHTWRTARHTLLGAGGQAFVQIRFVLDIGGSTVGPGVAIDDVRVLPMLEDVAAVQVSTKPFRCGGETAQPVTVDVRNDGNGPVSNIQVSYQLDNGTPVTETLAGPLAPGATVTHTFATQLASPTQGAHTLTATASTSSDFYPDNDSVQMGLYGADTRAMPYQEGFEQDDGGWTPFGTNSSWAWGVPRTINFRNPPGGAQVWATNLTGNYAAGEDSYLLSPCFDTTGLGSDPVVSLTIHRRTGSSDRVRLEMSSNGLDWNIVGDVGDGSNWYSFDRAWQSDQTDWQNAQNRVVGSAGLGLVQFRLHFLQGSSSPSNEEGFALDQFLFADDFVDASVSNVMVPSVVCGPAPLTMEVTNYGSVDLVDVPVSYSVDGGAPVTETLTGTIAPGTSASHTFAVPLDVSGDGTVQVLVNAMQDVRPANDVVVSMVSAPPPIAGDGYAEDFEGGQAGFRAGGTKSSWVWGAPVGTNAYLNSAASGSFAWLTNASGPYNSNEDSFIESPCFDFSTATNPPQLTFDLNYQSEPGYDGGWVEVSYDSGATWTKLGASGDSPEWYGNASRQWWDNVAGGWTTTGHAIDGAEGQFALLRFRFKSDGTSQQEGIAIDNVAISVP